MSSQTKQHEQKVSSIKSSREALKNESFSDLETQKKIEELKKEAKAEKVFVEQRINELQDKTDEKSKSEKEKAQAQLDTLNDIIDVQLSVLTQKIEWTEDSIAGPIGESIVNKTWNENITEEKWFLWKTWEWIGDQWYDVRDLEKWKEEWWKNLIRTVWFVATWVGAVALVVKWFKKLFWKDRGDNDKSDEKEEKKEKKDSWWKKFLIWAWITVWTAVGGVQIYKHWNHIKWLIKDLLGLNLSFEDAKAKVEAEVRNWINSDNKCWSFYAHFEWIDYDNSTQKVSSYWEETKIDYQHKKIEWLDVEFPDWEQLLHAVNIVNFAKRKLKGRWNSETPFTINQRWDISVWLSDSGQTEFISWSDSDLWKLILWWTWTLWWWLLWWYCAWIKWAAIWALVWWTAGYVGWAILDENSSLRKMCDTIKKWTHLSLFVNYLNSQKDENWKSLWTPHDQWPEAEDKNPIQIYVNKIVDEIEKAYWPEDSARRNLTVEYDESNPEIFVVRSYEKEVKLTLKWCTAKQWDKWIDFSKIKKIHIEKYAESDWWDWLDIDFQHTEEWLKEAIRTINLTNKIREDFCGRWREDYSFSCWRFIWLDWKSLYFDAWEFFGKWTRVINRKTFKQLYPTISKDVLSENIILTTHQKEYHSQAINDETKWSQYIKYLHQMRDWDYGYWKDRNL